MHRYHGRIKKFLKEGGFYHALILVFEWVHPQNPLFLPVLEKKILSKSRGTPSGSVTGYVSETN